MANEDSEMGFFDRLLSLFYGPPKRKKRKVLTDGNKKEIEPEETGTLV